ncbi:MAG TPA: LamG-like jellyroll fold domain-containing protein [Gemmatimonadaceae bacterium]|nr:LamG-like jellyroll fold domain-containing protein [Gemmatimonadaceae bacterium]
MVSVRVLLDCMSRFLRHAIAIIGITHAAVCVAQDTQPPTAPSNAVASAVSPTQVNVTWSPSSDNVGVTGYRVERCTGTSCTNFVEIGNSAAGPRTGPLRVSTQNPRYFMDSSGRAILLGGSQTWLNLVDVGTTNPPPAFDYTRWLDFLAANHHNFFRLWADSLPKRNWNVSSAPAGPWYTGQYPWLRSGPGNASDGRPKFDLTRFDETYFSRMRSRVQQAGARGIFVSVMLFDGFHVQNDRRADDGYPLTGSNNINAVDDGGSTRSQDLGQISPAVLAAQEAYVRKVIDTVNDLPNVAYEIANEAGSYSTGWQQHFITFIKNYEGTKAQQHPVGFTYQYAGGSDSTLYSSNADWVSPSERYPSNNGTRHVLINDTDHSDFWVSLQAEGPDGMRDFVWKNFTAGNSAMFMDPFLLPWPQRNNPGGCSGATCTATDPQWDPIRKNIGYMLDYANTKLDLARMQPRSTLSSTRNCLANAVATGAEYLVYSEGSGSFTVDLSATTRQLAVEWLNPSTGAISSGATVTGGATRSFTPPFSGKAVLYLADVAGHSTATSFADTTVAANTAYRYRVRAIDAAGNLGGYSTPAGTTTPAGGDTTPPTVSITAPTSGSSYTATSSSLSLSGTASDNVSVMQVSWSNDRGGSGMASGTTSWSASTVPLQPGSNAISVTAKDAAGNTTSDTLMVTYSAPSGGGGTPPVAAYNFNEGAGSALTDVSGNGNVGTISGATWTSSGRYGGALNFDGVNDRVFVAASASLNFSSAGTLEAWVYPTATQSGWRAIVQREVDAFLLHASNDAGPLRPAAGGTFNGAHPPSISAPSAIGVNTWTHLAVTYDGSTLRLYVNGAQVTSAARSGAIETNSNPLWIGGNNPYGEYFTGRIDDVRVYNRALTATELQADMNTPVDTPSPPAGSDTQAPTAPAGLTATPVSANQVNLSWTAATDNVGVTGYRVERCQGTSCTGFTQIATPSTTTYSNTGLTASTSYTYRVRAVDAAGNLGSYSNAASAMTQAPPGDRTPPTAPSAASATSTSSSQVNVSWTASTDDTAVTGYRVERCAGAGCTNFTQIATPTGTTFSDSSLAAATTYRYQVRATDAVGNLSGYSNIATATTQAASDTQAPTTPGSASASTLSSTQISVTWSAATDNVAVTSYPVERCSGASCTNFAQIGAPAGTSYSDSSLTPATTYRYRVRAKDAAGNLSQYSGIVNATTTSASPGAGPVAAYNFDEGAGSTLTDVSGNSNTGAVTGALWTSAGRNGGALDFDGVNDRVFVNASSSLNVTSSITLEAWVYPTATQSGWRTILQRQPDVYLLHASSGAGPLRPAAGGTFNGVHYPSISAPSAIPVNTWTHLAMTYDGTVLRIYVNGVQVATDSRNSGPIAATNNPFWIGGNDPYGEYFKGRIDDVRVYGRALGAAEIQSDMNRPVSAP